MNLLFDKWMPVMGSAGPIAPWEITEKNCTVQAVKSIRPDFDAALLCFLIGLYQFAFLEVDESAWVNRFFCPPSSDEVKARFLDLEIGPAFELIGDKSRFMQEPAKSLSYSSKTVDIGHILIDYPRHTKIEVGEDLLTRHEPNRSMCLKCCATALYAKQSFTGYGGVGHLSSIHNGSPIITFLIGQNLWETVWLNVLSAETSSAQIPADHIKEREAIREIFPWLHDSLTDWVGKDAAEQHCIATRSEDFYRLYWTMPERLRFADVSDGTCFLCGANGSSISRFYTGSFGINYKGYWPHPLVPSIVMPQETGSDAENEDKTQEDEVDVGHTLSSRNWAPSGSLVGLRLGQYAYLDWLGISLSDWGNDKSRIRPARVVSTYQGRRAEELNRCRCAAFTNGTDTECTVSLWVAGYVYDTKKQLCHQFINSKVPIVSVKGGTNKEMMHALFERAARGISEDAKVVLTALIKKIREIVGADVAREATKLFAASTELVFFQLITKAADNPVGYGADWKTHVARCGEGGWRKYLARQAVVLFDGFVDIMQMSNPADIVKAIKARSVIDKLGTIKQSGKKKGKIAVDDTKGRKHDKRK